MRITRTPAVNMSAQAHLPRRHHHITEFADMKETDDPVTVEQTVAASREDVWAALTEVEKMRVWYFENIPAFEPRVGFEVRFDVESNTRTFTHIWRVNHVEPMSSIGYEWQYAHHPGDSSVCFHLSDSEHGTHVVLTHTPIETFPQEIPEFQREACLQGWVYFVRRALPNFLDGDRPRSEE